MPKHRKQWVALVDGNETQLGLLLCAAESYGVELVIILDLIQVLEYLWKAARALHGADEAAAETWVRERMLEILRGRSSVVAAGMTRSATLRRMSVKAREPIDRCANYLIKYREFLRYDEYLAKGYPLATGVIEGTCRYLVKDRMEITGARWSLEGVEAVLQLRSLRASGDSAKSRRSLCRGETTSAAAEYKTNRKGESRSSQVGEMTGWCRSKRAAPGDGLL